MNRFFTQKLDDLVILTDENHSHIAYSLRLRVGDEIVLFCGDGFDYLYKIIDIKKSQTQARLISKTQNLTESNVLIDACVSLIKHDKMSFIYQKLTELGVVNFLPMITEFTQGKKGEFNIERYQKICIEACKQCGRSFLPNVFSPKKLEDIISTLCQYDLVVFAYEKAQTSLTALLTSYKNNNDFLSNDSKKCTDNGDKESINSDDKECIDSDSKESILKACQDLVSRKQKNVCVAVLIGPEGGFSDAEATMLKDAGILGVSLGKRILRAETAAIACVSAILYQLDW